MILLQRLESKTVSKRPPLRFGDGHGSARHLLDGNGPNLSWARSSIYGPAAHTVQWAAAANPKEPPNLSPLRLTSVNLSLEPHLDER